MATVAICPSFLGTRLGKLTLGLLCPVAFLDCVDASIVNIALPSMRRDLHMSVQTLQWVPSAYLLTYGGVMLLGGRMADLLGRHRILIIGTVLFGFSSFTAGLAEDSGVLIGARLAQVLGAAMMLLAGLSILTTRFGVTFYNDGPEESPASPGLTTILGGSRLTCRVAFPAVDH